MEYVMHLPIPSVTLLSLRRNGLTLPSHFELCNSLRNLETVNFANNDIAYIPKNMFKNCRKLKFIDLSYNKLKIVPNQVRHYLSEHGSITMDLSGNPLICSCQPDAIETIKWIHNYKDRHKNIAIYMCSNYGGLTDRQILGINIDKHVESCERWSVLEIIILTCLVNLSLILLAISAFLRRKYRYRILNMLFSCKRLCSGKDHNKTFKYTLYLIYCKEDRLWVHDTLLDELENIHGIRCCVHYRDFPGNGFLSEIIPRFMDQSRFVLAVLSEKSIHKYWIQYELQRARDLELRNSKRILYIKYGYLGTSIPADIRQVLDSNIYIDWPDNVDDADKRRVFFEKLIGAIRGEQLCGSGVCCVRSKIVTLGDENELEQLT